MTTLKLEVLILPFVPLLLMGAIAALRHAGLVALMQRRAPFSMVRAETARRSRPC